ncbi:MAG: potassium channel family protein [Micromonosporaceae bacterium]
MSYIRRIELALLALVGVLIAGSIGYVVLGFSLLDAVYQTVTTITTVGFREVRPLDSVGKIFTIALIIAGVGTALYTFSVVLETLVEGHLRQLLGRRRMDRDIARMSGHAIVCGWGRVGRAVGGYLAGQGAQVVVVDNDPERVAATPYPAFTGDVTDDEVLRRAGIMQARALIAAINTDAENVYVTLSARALRPDLVIIARARTEASEPKLLRAGATRVVNPQRIGGQRIAAAALQPNVVEFLDVVMHDGSLEFRLEEVHVKAGSRLAGRALSETGGQDSDSAGALVLALRHSGRAFMTNPPLHARIEPGTVLIAIGTEKQLSALKAAASPPPEGPGTV